MSNIVTVSFKLPPDHYAVLQALAKLDGTTVSEFVRHRLTDCLNLAGLSDTFRHSVRESESANAKSE